MHYVRPSSTDNAGPVTTKGVQAETKTVHVLTGKTYVHTKHLTTYEKEASAIVETFERMSDLSRGLQPVHVFPNQQDMLYGSSPLTLHTNCPRHVLFKVHLRAIHLLRFEFVIGHMEGANNNFANLLARRSKGYRNRITQIADVVATLYVDKVLAAKKTSCNNK